MGLGDWMSGILGAQNSYHADPRVNTYQVNQGGYGSAAQQAILNAQKNYDAQASNISQLQGAASGTGPSVAEQLLAQQTQSNNQGAASLVAGQRGLNPALAARMALAAQTSNNQSAAQSGALAKSQEQIQARSSLLQALGQQGSQNNQLLGVAGGLDANLQSQAAGVAGQNAQLAYGADQINAGVAAQNAGTAGALAGGLLAGAGAAGPMGSIKTPGGASTGGNGSGAAAGGGSAMTYGGGSTAGAAGSDASATFGLGEGADAAALALSGGGKVPGRAAVPGNSPKNDTVQTDLSPGEIVVPRSASTDPDRAAAFVRAVIRKQSSPKGYGAILALQKQHGDRLRALEARR